jgi:hypothetical protein
MRRAKAMPPLSPELVERFNACVERGAEDDCWPWVGLMKSQGYGQFSFKRVRYIASRLAYFLANGALEPDQIVCHACDNPPCCNPRHLFSGSHKDNAQDCVRKGRMFNPVGEKHSRSRLTEAAVREIRCSDLTLRALAAQYGVTHTTVRHARVGLSWRHIPMNARLYAGALDRAEQRLAAMQGRVAR